MHFTQSAWRQLQPVTVKHLNTQHIQIDQMTVIARTVIVVVVVVLAAVVYFIQCIRFPRNFGKRYKRGVETQETYVFISSSIRSTA